MFLSRTHLLILAFCMLKVLVPTFSFAWPELDTDNLLHKMEEAYAHVRDYQARMEIRVYTKEGSHKTKKFLYTFKRPNMIRLDFESPHSGMVLVYPDKEGKVVIRPAGWARFFKLRIDSDSSLLRVSSGQRIDQTDLGLLIKKISNSLTAGRHSEVEAVEDDEHINLGVLADSHFREGVVTFYRFFISKELWMPLRVEESTPDGVLERTVIYQNLKINVGVPDNAFQLNGD